MYKTKVKKSFKDYDFDIATVAGLGGAFGLILIALFLGGNLISFLNVPSFLIVIGGTIFATMACFTIEELKESKSVILKAAFKHSYDVKSLVISIIKASEVARVNGLLGLEGHPLNVLKKTKFLHDGLSMLIDGIEVKEVLKTVEHAINSDTIRKKKASEVLRKAAEIAPAFGLIGTLIGLIQMLSNMNDPSSIGPAMAVALITTFYGAILANVVLNPLASKLERNNEEDFLMNQLCLLGISSIARLENPRKTEIVLNSVLKDELKVNYFD